MGVETAISWCDHTFNPWVGCTPISHACDHCYAENWAKRTGHPELWNGERRRTSSANWRQPYKWNAAAWNVRQRHRVFCASLADVFDNQVPERWRDDLWYLIEQTSALDWLLLTKRPQNIAKMLPSDRIGTKPWGAGWANVWLGTTVENQEEAERRIPHLLGVPARIRFLSCEPLLRPVNLHWISGIGHNGLDALAGEIEENETGRKIPCPRINWVIAGGESGSGARPMHPDWARSLRDQCAAAGVPFHLKQWGEWTPGENVERRSGTVPSAHWFDDWMFSSENLANTDGHRDDEPDLYRVGKKAAGRWLDGVIHDAFPDMTLAPLCPRKAVRL